ncbi:MAG: hypothetical protein ACREXT_11780 [Gammaproteobacteria bacterium]
MGILSGGGVGMVMAQWIATGSPPMDMWSVDIRRAHPWQDNDRYLHHRAVRERVGLFEQSSFAKILVIGRDATRALNRIATNVSDDYIRSGHYEIEVAGSRFPARCSLKPLYDPDNLKSR